MRISLFGSAATCALVLTGSTFAGANAPLTPESPGQSLGVRYVDYRTGHSTIHNNVVGSYIYDNVDDPSAPNFGYSEPNANAPSFGDTLNMAGVGKLDEAAVSIFNSTTGGNTGAITGGTVDIEFFRQSDGSSIGGFSGNFDLTASPLPAGFFTFLDFTDLATLPTPVVFDTPNVYMIQTLTSITGTSTRNGVVSLNPIDIGTSPDTVYLSSTATAAGFYNFNPAGTQANFGYLVGVAAVPEPGTLSLLGLAGLAVAHRRRKA